MISVIIPCYNYGHLIADTIDSIKSQTNEDWEIIIVDDDSTDNTEEVVAGYLQTDNRIKYYKQQNAGPSAARNRALQYAKGAYVQFLDADDLIEKNKFEIQLNIFRENPEVDIVYGNVRYFKKDPYDPEDRLMTYWGSDKEWMLKLSGPGLEILEPALKGSIAHISCFLFKKSIIDKAGPFDERKRAAEDYLFVLNCVMINAFFLYRDIPGSYSLVRWHANNTSKDTSWIREGEKKMRIELRPRLAAINNVQAIERNEDSIKGLSYLVNRNWKTKFLSGGPFDFIKKWLRAAGLEKFARRMFFGRHNKPGENR